MSFPIVEQVKVTHSAGVDVDPFAINWPDTNVAGELQLALVCIDSAISGGGTDINMPAGGWSLLFTFQEVATQSFEVWARVAVGGESGTFNTDFEEVQQAAAQIYRISNWYGTIATGVSVSTRVDGQDPPNLTPPWGAADTLWIAAAFASISTGFTSYPSGYTNGVFTSSAASSGGAQIASARRLVTAASENPGSFNWTGGADTLTIAVRPPDTVPTVVPRIIQQMLVA